MTDAVDLKEFAGYRIVRLIGSGGMGEVYLAKHPNLPREDALKILPESLGDDEGFRARFIREADVAAGLWHEHIVGVHDRGEYNGQLWISMDYVDGSDAGQLLKSEFTAGMPLSVVVKIATAVADALDFAHSRELLHRDVKPSNILLSGSTRGRRRILLADFGIARRVDDVSGLTATDAAIGTVRYAAPEQLTGQDLDGRSDQYALAVTVFELLTAKPLFAESNPAVVIGKHLNATPPAASTHRRELVPIDHVIEKALAKSPADRYPTCSAFAEALATAAADVSEPPPEDDLEAPTPDSHTPDADQTKVARDIPPTAVMSMEALEPTKTDAPTIAAKEMVAARTLVRLKSSVPKDSGSSHSVSSNESPKAGPASWGARLAAIALDVLPGVATLTTLGIVVVTTSPGTWLRWVLVSVIAVVVVAMLANRVLLPTITGFSLGRAVCGLRVVRADGGSVGVLRLLLRDLAHLLDTAAVFIGWLWPLWDKRSRTFADLLARTEVRVVDPPQRNARRIAGGVLVAAVAVSAVAAGLGYAVVFRQERAVEQARTEIAEQGPRIVEEMLSYGVDSVGADFARAQGLATDGYRETLIEQQKAAEAAGLTTNEYWAVSSAVMSVDQQRAAMLLALQGQRGANADDLKFITATVRVDFEHVGDQWKVSNLQVLKRPLLPTPAPPSAPPAESSGAPTTPAPTTPASQPGAPR